MTFNPDKHYRRSLRLQGYDYSQDGAYFVTICTHNRECLFGDIADGEMVFNDYGKIVKEEWLKSSEIRREISLDEHIVMPNHFHGIVIIRRGDWPVAPTTITTNGPKSGSIGSFVVGFKSAITRRINDRRKTPGVPVWQRNYYEHVIRDDDDLNRIREYIKGNPVQWAEDEENPTHIKL